MSNTKLLSFLSNLAIFANLAVGFWQVHWAVIVLFVGIHTLLRLSYLKAQHTPPDSTPTITAPPAIKNIAIIITAMILAVATYGIGYGIRYLTNSF